MEAHPDPPCRQTRPMFSRWRNSTWTIPAIPLCRLRISTSRIRFNHLDDRVLESIWDDHDHCIGETTFSSECYLELYMLRVRKQDRLVIDDRELDPIELSRDSYTLVFDIPCSSLSQPGVLCSGISSTSRTFPACQSPRRPPTAWYPIRPTPWLRGSFRKTRSTGRSTDISSQKRWSRISQHNEKNSDTQGDEESVPMLTLRTHHSILPQSFSLAIRPRCPKRTFPIPAARRLGVTYRSSSCHIDIHRTGVVM